MEKKVQNFDFEILEKKKINPYITECKIKAFYLEDNRNGSYITPEVGIMLAESIYNAPIVGYYSEEQQDFLGHEVDMKINIETGKIDTVPLTVPFGVGNTITLSTLKCDFFESQSNSQISTFVNPHSIHNNLLMLLKLLYYLPFIQY